MYEDHEVVQLVVDLVTAFVQVEYTRTLDSCLGET